MCLACMEYIKGNLNWQEFQGNIGEYPQGTEHDPEAVRKWNKERKPRIRVNLLDKKDQKKG